MDVPLNFLKVPSQSFPGPPCLAVRLVIAYPLYELNFFLHISQINTAMLFLSSDSDMVGYGL